MIDWNSFPFPEQWKTASDFWTNLVQSGGMPTDISPWWQAQQQAAGQQVTRAGQQAAEQFGLGGMRYSTPLGQQLGRIGAETTAGIMPQYWQMGMQAQEAAKARQMTGAEALMGAGSEYGRYPLEVGERMLSMGGEYQRQQQAAMYPALSEFQRMLSENNPYLQYGMNFPYGQFGQQPQMYQPSFFGQMGGTAAQIAPYLFGPGGACGAKTAAPTSGWV